ncbi:MAG: aromatic ring-hydroxylating oxygenase subunit alpha [Gammaproteobacteria bacterium]
MDLGNAVISKDRYLSPGFLRQEFDHVWGRVWQMACREEDLPSVGDYLVYEIGTCSLLLVRCAPDRVKAFHNACLHRGRLLKEDAGSAQFIRCPFHAFTWNLDGSCRHITNDWDFPHLDKTQLSLPEAHVDRWGGFIFVNVSDEPEPLASYLEDLPEIYATRGWDLGQRLKSVHVQKEHECNWKVALEAFIESFHVVATHPGAMTYLGDAFTQYDVWSDRRHYTRMISPRGIASPHVGKTMTEEDIYRAGTAGYGSASGDAKLPAGLTARQAMADLKRKHLKIGYGVDVPDMTDTEALDTIQYHIFPNLVCWAGWGSFLVYRFRPHGTDPNRSTMEVFFLVPHDDDHPVEVARKPHVLSAAQSHHDAPELGPFAAVFDEDLSNLPQIQRGLAAMKGPGINLGRYEEMRIRFFHGRIDDYIAGRA